MLELLSADQEPAHSADRSAEDCVALSGRLCSTKRIHEEWSECGSLARPVNASAVEHKQCWGCVVMAPPNLMLVMCSYKKLPVDVQPGSQILCADGSIVLEVLKCNPDQGTVRCKCTNNATLG